MADILDKKAVAKLVRDIDRQMQRIAKERDKLDDIISTANAVLNDCDEARDDLQRARDALSRYV